MAIDTELDRLDKQLEEALNGIYEETDLAKAIEKAFDVARSHRMACDIDEALDYCLHSAQGKYTPGEMTLYGIEPGRDIYAAAITPTKVMALQSWLHDVFGDASERPWTLSPTPMPEVSEEVEKVVTDRVAQEAQQLAQQMGGQPLPPEVLQDLLRKHRSLMYADMSREARRGADLAERKLQDLLEEGGWRKAFEEFLDDIAIYPSAFLRGPYKAFRRKLTWTNGVPSVELVPAMTVERVSPFDVFPSPDSTDTQDGAYIIERLHLTAAELESLKKLPNAGAYGVYADEIDRLFAQHPNGYRYTSTITDEQQNVSGDDKRIPEAVRYEVIVYYGKMARERVDEFLQDRARSDDMATVNELPREVEEIEAWVCGGQVLRLVRNEQEFLRRPLWKASFRDVPGQFWGVSLPLVLRNVQRLANAVLRSLVVNMAVSSAPIGEYDPTRLEMEERITEIEPHRMYAVVDDERILMTGAPPVFRFHDIDSHARELILVYQEAEKMADTVSGVPAYVLGQPQAGVARTLGGLALLLSNAAKGVKRVVRAIDRNIIEPLVSEAYRIAIMNDKELARMSDLQVVARGASGLLKRELQQARALEVLQLLTPYVQNGMVPQSAIALLLRDVVRSLGYEADELVPDPRRQPEMAQILAETIQQQGQQQLQEQLQMAQQQQVAPFSVEGVKLDGRSEPARQAANELAKMKVST